MKAILEYSSDADDNRLWYGLVLALAYGCAEILKCICFVTQWLINYTTGISGSRLVRINAKAIYVDVCLFYYCIWKQFYSKVVRLRIPFCSYAFTWRCAGSCV